MVWGFGAFLNKSVVWNNLLDAESNGCFSS